MFRRLILGQLRDEEETEVSKALAIILWILLSASLLLLGAFIALPQFSARWSRLLVVIYAVCIPAFFLNRRGYTRFASIFLILGLWGVSTGAALTAGGIASFGAYGYLILVFVSILLLGPRASIATALLCILTTLGLVLIDMTGHMPSTVLPHTPFSRWIFMTLLTVILVGLQYLSVRRVNDALRRSRQELEERKRAEEELRKVSERLQLATSAASIGIWDWDVINDELVWDDAMYRLYGIRKEDFSGAYEAWAKSLAPEDFERANVEVQAALRGEQEFADEYRIVWPDGSIHFTKAAAQTFRDEAGRPLRMVGVNYDITGRKLAEEQVNLLQLITMDVAEAEDVPAALKVVLRRVCEKTGWVLGQAWVPRQDGTGLDCCPAWFATNTSLDEFRALSRNIRISTGIGLPGRVWASRQPAWIRDVTQDTNFPRAEAARKVGLKAALGVPILSGDEVIAVLEFFLSKPREEDERLVKVIAAVAAQIGLVIERKRFEEENRKLIHHLGERVKELMALHHTANILQHERADVSLLLREVASLLPPAFQYPEITAARVRLDEIEAATPGFIDSLPVLRADFETADGQAGSIEVVYTKECPPEAEGPYLAEERALINTLAEMLRTDYDRRQSEGSLRESEERFRQLTDNLREVLWLYTPDYGRGSLHQPRLRERLGAHPRQPLPGSRLVSRRGSPRRPCPRGGDHQKRARAWG